MQQEMVELVEVVQLVEGEEEEEEGEVVMGLLLVVSKVSPWKLLLVQWWPWSQ